MIEVWPGAGRVVAREGGRMHHTGSTCSLSSPCSSSSPRPLLWTSSLPRRSRRQPGEWNYYERTESCYDLTTLHFGRSRERGREEQVELVRSQSGLIVPPRSRRGKEGGRRGQEGGRRVEEGGQLVRTQSGLMVPPRTRREVGGKVKENSMNKKEDVLKKKKEDHMKPTEARVAPTPPPRKKSLQKLSYCRVMAGLMDTKPLSEGSQSVSVATKAEARQPKKGARDGTCLSAETNGAEEEIATRPDAFWKLINSNMALNYFMNVDNNNLYVNDVCEDDFLAALGTTEAEVWRTPRESWMTTSDGYVDCPEDAEGFYAKIHKPTKATGEPTFGKQVRGDILWNRPAGAPQWAR